MVGILKTDEAEHAEDTYEVEDQNEGKNLSICKPPCLKIFLDLKKKHIDNQTSLADQTNEVDLKKCSVKLEDPGSKQK